MTQYQVALAFEDGVTRFITCTEDQTVADASYRRGSTSGWTAATEPAGRARRSASPVSSTAASISKTRCLRNDEAEQGYVLTCVMKPRSDLVLKIASTSEVAETQAATYVSEMTEVHPAVVLSTVSFAVEIPNRDELVFLPGQYVNIAVPGTDESRSYSFSNAPHEEPDLPGEADAGRGDVDVPR